MPTKFELEYLIFIYSYSIFHVIIKNVDFECWYIRTHEKQKPSPITFTILPFLLEKKYPNLFTILCGVDAITPDVTNEKLFIL